MKRIAILGSTGSIGTQTLDVIARHPQDYEVVALSANSSIDLLAEQALRFKPKFVCIADELKYSDLKQRLQHTTIQVGAGKQALSDMVERADVDVVVVATVGYAGLIPTLAAIRAGKTIALANKETLVVAGEIVMREIAEHSVQLLPVDSEHSAIFQCLQGEEQNQVEKILLTASGGPFRTFTKEAMQSVTAAQALKHPRWDMGAKITIDSATMMNKGFEIIEAKWLFGVPVERIEVVVHPESIVHSAVQFADGCIKAQLGIPDMRMPIQYALTYPNRVEAQYERVNLFDLAALHFEKPDLERFPNLKIAYRAIEQGGNMPCIVNAANEIAVAAYLKDRISFFGMSDAIETAMQKMPFISNPTLDDYIQTDAATRAFTKELITP